MKAVFALATTTFLLSPLAKADSVYDRIDRCQQSNGAGGCIYNLLREIAGGTNSTPDRIITWCQCEDTRGDFGITTLVAYSQNVNTNAVNKLALLEWSRNGNNGHEECETTMATHPRCR